MSSPVDTALRFMVLRYSSLSIAFQSTTLPSFSQSVQSSQIRIALHSPRKKDGQYSNLNTYQLLDQNCHEEVCQYTVRIALNNTGGKLKVILCNIEITNLSIEIIDAGKELIVIS